MDSKTRTKLEKKLALHLFRHPEDKRKLTGGVSPSALADWQLRRALKEAGLK